MRWKDGEQKVGTHGKRPRTCGDMPGNTETEEVEKGNTQGDDNARPQHSRVVDHLVPTTGEVKEGRTGSPCGYDGHEDNNGGCPKETLETDSIKRGDGILCHDLFFDNELGCSADDGGENRCRETRGLLTRAERTGRRRCLHYFRRVG